MRDIFEWSASRLRSLYLVTEKFAGIDLHPEAVDNHEMGLAFEEL